MENEKINYRRQQQNKTKIKQNEKFKLMLCTISLFGDLLLNFSVNIIKILPTQNHREMSCLFIFQFFVKDLLTLS